MSVVSNNIELLVTDGLRSEQDGEKIYIPIPWLLVRRL
jgi:hypothetical protein